ncbi:hypothetical protein [Fluviispira sanaruensis]|uniref:Uncharacterized protein n=1 Tax=Fluviispira sanaruensis TaxID=2493639 RepID=A0A4P2VR45_FLUSA|nr:hypothetical protein [Fluviispira sanaruensis]BBH54714.1 hypothetical protein JCM31447_31880 [Fluviispira sanaruensis]
MSNKIISSFEKNQPKTFLSFKVKSFTYAIFGVFLGFFIGRILGEIIPPLAILTPIILGLFSFAFSEWFYGGKYANEKRENIIGTFFKQFSIKKVRMSEEKQSTLYAEYKSKKDNNSLFDMEGNEIIGFEILRGDDKEFELVFQSLVENILKTLPAHDQVQFVRVNKDFEDENLFKGREILLEKRVKSQRYFIFFSIYYGVNQQFKQECIERLEEIGVQLNRKEMSNYCQFVFAPNNHPKNTEEPIYPLTYFFGDKVVHAYNGDLIHGASSLASIPRYVSPDFKEFYRPIDKVDSVLCIGFRSRNSAISVLKDALGVLRNEKLEDKKSNVKKIESFEQQMIDKDEGRNVNLCMSLNIIAFGHKEDVNKALTDLERRAEEFPEFDFRPIFCRENAFIREALFSVLPGNRSYNKNRNQNIYSSLEASYYIPFPVMKHDISDKRAFNFRTEENTIWSFPYYKPMATLIAGLPGSGKSLIAGRLFNHHIEMGRQGYRASGFILDLGDSFLFLEDGLADFTFKLSYDNSILKYRPLEIHPLNLFKPFGDRIKYAKKFICQIMGFDPDEPKSQSASDGEIIIAALREFYTKNLNRMSEFKEILEEKLPEFFERISNKELKKANWDEYKARLNNFCKGGLNGEIFDPEKVKYTEKDLENIRFLYACKNTQSKEDKALISAFASLVLEFGNLLEEKFKSGGENEPSNFFYCIDEMQWWRDFIPHSWLRERASQNRKFGASLWLLTQDACDLLIPKIVLEEDRMASEYSLLEAMQRVFFFTLPQNLKVLSVLAREPLTEMGSAIPRGRIESMHKIAKNIQFSIKQSSKNIKSSKFTKGTDRLVGYCDQHLNMFALCADYEKEFLWASTTHDGGRSIRKKALKYSELPFFEVCKKLANWEGSIPENQVSNNFEIDILKTAFQLDNITI